MQDESICQQLAGSNYSSIAGRSEFGEHTYEQHIVADMTSLEQQPAPTKVYTGKDVALTFLVQAIMMKVNKFATLLTIFVTTKNLKSVDSLRARVLSLGLALLVPLAVANSSVDPNTSDLDLMSILSPYAVLAVAWGVVAVQQRLRESRAWNFRSIGLRPNLLLFNGLFALCMSMALKQWGKDIFITYKL